jgi:hypothetical protein
MPDSSPPPVPSPAMPDERGPLEVIYDAEISPLMVGILAVCKRHNLPMFCTFSLDGDLACTSLIAPPVEEVPDENQEHYAKWRGAIQHAHATIRPAPAFFAYTITTRPADASR